MYDIKRDKSAIKTSIVPHQIDKYSFDGGKNSVFILAEGISTFI